MPEISATFGADESGKGARAFGEFVNIADQTKLNAVAGTTPLGALAAYYPVVEGDDAFTTMTVELPEGWKVGLRQDKNKLFGKLEPIFK